MTCSELCTNAIAHASPAPQSIALRAALHGDAVVLEVEDDGPGLDLDLQRDLADDRAQHERDHEHGRGLSIVRKLTDRLDVRRVGDRTIVRCDTDAVAAPPPSTDRASGQAGGNLVGEQPAIAG